MPSDVRSAVVEAIETRSGLAGFGQTLAIAEVAIPRLQRDSDGVGDVSRDRGHSSRAPRSGRRDYLPAVIRSAVERRDERIITAGVKRPKVLLIAD